MLVDRTIPFKMLTRCSSKRLTCALRSSSFSNAAGYHHPNQIRSATTPSIHCKSTQWRFPSLEGRGKIICCSITTTTANKIDAESYDKYIKRTTDTSHEGKEQQSSERIQKRSGIEVVLDKRKAGKDARTERLLAEFWGYACSSRLRCKSLTWNMGR